MQTKSIDKILKEVTDNGQLQCYAKLENDRIQGTIQTGFSRCAFTMGISGERLEAVSLAAREPVTPSQMIYLRRCANQMPEGDSLIKKNTSWWFVTTSDDGEAIRLIRRLRTFLTSLTEASQLLEQSSVAQQYLSLNPQKHERR